MYCLVQNFKEFRCDCAHPFHQLILEKDEDGFLAVYYSLKDYLPIHKRIYNAFLYVFGIHTRKYDYCDIYLNKTEQERLAAFLNDRKT